MERGGHAARRHDHKDECSGHVRSPGLPGPGAGGPGSSSYCISSALHVHEIACETVTDGVQILGGNGYMKDYGQEKRFRDARQVQALLGTVPMRKLGLIRRDRGLE